MSKKESIITFIKKNGFYMALALVILFVTIILAVATANSGNVSPTFKPNSSSLGGASSSSNSLSSGGDSSSEDKPQETLPTVITFIMPVERGEVTKEYCIDGVVFNPTLGVYSVHLAVDIAGLEGAKVFAAYSGTVESVETSYLLGTVVTINHGNNLKTVYSSLEVDENLTVGQKVDKGEEIGVVSTTNRQEYKDGAHLHFEVLKNGEKVNPMDYLLLEDEK